MAVIRTEKNTNYTTMSNYHLKDRRLTLKAKGYRTILAKAGTSETEAETVPAENEEDALYSEGKLTRVPAELTFVPYAYWGNRNPGEMIVWVRTLIR
jgi:DUF1680 family protein